MSKVWWNGVRGLYVSDSKKESVATDLDFLGKRISQLGEAFARDFTGWAAKSALQRKKQENVPATCHDMKDDESDEFKWDDDSDEDDPATRQLLAQSAEKIKQIQARQQAKKGEAKSNLTLDVSPIDADTDMAKLEQEVREIQIAGIKWLGSSLIPVAYGLRKLRIMCQLVDELVGTDRVQEAIEKLSLVMSTRVFAFQMA